MLRRQPLVGRVHVGEQERDGQGVDALLHEAGHGLVEGVRVQGNQHVPGLVEAFGDLRDAAARDETLAPGIENVEHLLTLPLPRDLVDVAKPLGGEKAGAAALLLQHRVERVGGPVQQVGQGFGTPLGAHVRQHPVEHVQRRRGIGRHLADFPDLSRVLVQDRDIREGAANVNADSEAHPVALPLAWCRRTGGFETRPYKSSCLADDKSPLLSIRRLEATSAARFPDTSS